MNRNEKPNRTKGIGISNFEDTTSRNNRVIKSKIKTNTTISPYNKLNPDTKTKQTPSAPGTKSKKLT